MANEEGAVAVSVSADFTAVCDRKISLGVVAIGWLVLLWLRYDGSRMVGTRH